MKIREIQLNERQDKISGSAHLKQLGSDVGNALGASADKLKAAWNSPTAVKARDMGANALDATKSAIYKTTGYGGKQGNVASTKNKFTSDFTQQFNMAARAARTAGVPFDATDFIKAQAQQYGWNIADDKAEMLAQAAGNDASKMAQGMYAVGMSQPRYKSDTGLGDVKQARQYDADVTVGGDPVDLNPQSQQIINQIKKLKGAGNTDDVEKIASAALNMLYTGNRKEYAMLVRRLSGRK